MISYLVSQRLWLRHGRTPGIKFPETAAFGGVPVTGWSRRTFLCPDAWLAGEVLKEESFPFGEGLYSIVAHQQRGIVELRDVKSGKPVARGDLDVCIGPTGPPTGTIAKVAVTKFDVNLKTHHIEVCGEASISIAGVDAKIEGCIRVDWK